MAENPKREAIERLGTFLSTLEGKEISIKESICMSEDAGFDRHATIESYFEFKVTQTGWQVSGGHLHVYGESAKYAIFSKALKSVEINERGVVALERFERETLRKTEIVRK